MKHGWTRREGWAKGTAAAVGGPLHLVAWAVAVSAVLARLGLGESAAAAAGVWIAVPAGAAFVAIALLARSGARAWLYVGGGAALLGAVGAALALL